MIGCCSVQGRHLLAGREDSAAGDNHLPHYLLARRGIDHLFNNLLRLLAAQLLLLILVEY